ncbi:SLATT domain-containing protein [Streptomyces sp. NBC_00572]|uniref:SLATT domain-containing protein n=1 Tax=Streptomyces sp. NBC_00572 TaxID=2903664 RepID=UPI00224DFD34|nr:SLATT domain-containing protein [Streptomyces sp. NBC_00572]MCX4985936.1 SLATT domain-containing protein [Streptomyces sp. NBC_00572]
MDATPTDAASNPAAPASAPAPEAPPGGASETGTDGEANRRQALDAEFRRLEESAMWSAQCQFEEGKRWRATHWALGLPATLLAAIAGTTALVESTGATAAGILALLSAGLGAILTTVNAPQRASQAVAAANVYLSIQTAARQHREIDLPAWTTVEAREALAALTTRRDEQNAGADPPSRRAYRKAHANLSAGGQTYTVDGPAPL